MSTVVVGYGFQQRLSVCLRLCLSVFLHDISKTAAAAKITKLNIETFHHMSWKPTYFGIKLSNVKVTRQKIKLAWVYALLRVPVDSNRS